MAVVTIHVPHARGDLKQPTHVVVGELTADDTVGRLHQCVLAAMSLDPLGSLHSGQLSRLVYPRGGPAPGEWQTFVDLRQSLHGAGISDGAELVWNLRGGAPDESGAAGGQSRRSPVRGIQYTALSGADGPRMLSPAFAPEDDHDDCDVNSSPPVHREDEPVDLNDIQLPHPPGSSRASPQRGAAPSPIRGPRPRDAPAPLSPPVARRLPTDADATPISSGASRACNIDSPPRSLISEIRSQPESRRRTPAVPMDAGGPSGIEHSAYAADRAGDGGSPQPTSADRSGGQYTLSTGETLDVATEEELKLVRELEVLRARRVAAHRGE